MKMMLCHHRYWFLSWYLLLGRVTYARSEFGIGSEKIPNLEFWFQPLELRFFRYEV